MTDTHTHTPLPYVSHGSRRLGCSYSEANQQASKHDSLKLYRRLSLSQIRERVTDATRVQGFKANREGGNLVGRTKVLRSLCMYVCHNVCQLIWRATSHCLGNGCCLSGCQGPWVPLLRSCSAGLSSLIPPFHVAKHGGSSQGRPTILAIRSLAFTLDVRNHV